MSEWIIIVYDDDCCNDAASATAVKCCTDDDRDEQTRRVADLNENRGKRYAWGGAFGDDSDPPRPPEFKSIRRIRRR